MNVRQVERESIRAFMERNRHYLRGRVLDFGAGQQPYRDLVDGEYVPHEENDDDDICRIYSANPFDAVLCTQVMQYVADPYETLSNLKSVLKNGGKLILTYPTCWDEVEETDFWRFTKAGMERLLVECLSMKILIHERRAEIRMPEDGFTFPLGYGLVAERI